MSASSSPTLWPISFRARARLVATVDLPTPPLPEATATMCLTPGSEIFCGGPGGCMEAPIFAACGVAFFRYAASGRSLRDRLTVLAEFAEEFEGVDAGVVAVAPDDLVGVA